MRISPMRRKLLIPFLLLSLAIPLWLLWHKQADKKDKAEPVKVDEIQNESTGKTTPSGEQDSNLRQDPGETAAKNYRFILEPLQTESVSFTLPGRLEYGENTQNQGAFSKNELLFYLDNSRVFGEIKREKSLLKDKLENLHGEIKTHAPEAYSRWLAYTAGISETDLLPSPPEGLSSQELSILNREGIMQQIGKIQVLERQIFSYFYLAPFEGRFKKILVPPGTEIREKQTVALIFPTESLILKGRVHRNDLEYYTNKRSFKIGGETVTLKFRASGDKTADSVQIRAKTKASALKPFDFYSIVTIE